jgi:20S proteasome alpha/beta subunit
MTMVSACLFGDEAVIIADSRVTWEASGRRLYGDYAQKILSLGKNVAFAFAGDIEISGSILNEMRRRIRKNPRLVNRLRLPAELSRVAGFQYHKLSVKRGKSDISVFIILAGVIAGKVYLWRFDSPLFSPRIVRSEYVIIGSGSTIEPRLRSAFAKLAGPSLTLKSKADVLITELESELKKQGVKSVGGLFQVILISATGGIVPLDYGFVELRPEKPGKAKEMTAKSGVWTQRDLSKGKEVTLLEPGQIVSLSPAEEHFHDFELLSPIEKELRWYLNYFITCLRLGQTPNKIIFEDVLSQIGAAAFPIELPLILAIGFWGPGGKHTLTISVDDEGKLAPLYVQEISIPFPSELNEFEILVELQCAQPGPIFINCYLDDFLIGRKALYLARMDRIRSVSEDDKKQSLIDKHRECSDPELSKAGCFLEYFILCQHCVIQELRYEFIEEARAIYWRKYPLLFRAQLAASFRLPKGRHRIRVDLVNAMTVRQSLITEAEVNATHDCLVNRIHGNLVIKIPSAGIYFISLYIDEQFITSEVLPAETDKPKYSYSLPEDSIRAVSAGELIILGRRSKSQKEVS